MERPVLVHCNAQTHGNKEMSGMRNLSLGKSGNVMHINAFLRQSNGERLEDENLFRIIKYECK